MVANARRTGRHREMERAYEAGADIVLPDLRGGPVGSVGAPLSHDLVATYHDTADLRLARSRVTLRRRTGGDDDGWHLKLPADGSARTEVRRPVGRSPRVPASVRRLLPALTRGDALIPVVELRTARTETPLLDADGRVLADVADDVVTSRVLLGGDDPHVLVWREVEVELVGGDAALLGSIDRTLRSSGLTVATQQSKLRRALGPRLPDPEPAHPLLAYLAGQRVELLTQDVLTRDSADDGVHRMRIAARRLRSALRTYRRLFADPSAVDALADELRWLGRELSAERDLEVVDAELHARLAGDQAPPAATRLVRRVLGAERRSAHERTTDALGAERHLALLASLDALVGDAALHERAGRKPRRELTRGVRRALRRLERRVVAASDAGEPGSAARRSALHDARKAAKRLRYACEVAEPVAGKRARRLRRRAKRLSSALGEHQDTVVLRGWLRRLSEDGATTAAAAFAFGRLHATGEAAGADAVARAQRAWDRLARPKSVGWLR